jgi:hypothetical protein
MFERSNRGRTVDLPFAKAGTVTLLVGTRWLPKDSAEVALKVSREGP